MIFKRKAAVIKLDYIDDHNHWYLIKGYENYRSIRRIKHINKKRGNCFFAKGVKLCMMDFIYRAVKKLKLTGCELVFSKGAVKKRNIASNSYCSVSKMPWLNAISIKIPYRLAYDKKIDIVLNGEMHIVRKMELLVLGTLLMIRYPKKNNVWYSNTAAGIIINGWVFLEGEAGH